MRRRAALALILTVLACCGVALFGAAVKSAAETGDKAGWVARAAWSVASAPATLAALFEDGDASLIEAAHDPLVSFDGFAPLPSRPGVPAVPGLVARGEVARLVDGWRLALGAFEIDGAPVNAAVLISAELRIEHVWPLADLDEQGRERSPQDVLAHGLAVLPDGSLIVAFDGGQTLQRVGPCGDRRWATRGAFRYAVSPDESGLSAWTILGGDAVAEVAIADGAVLRKISMADVIAANPKLDPLEVRRDFNAALGANPREFEGAWSADPVHLNDVEPLTGAWARQFPKLRGGDLLLSARALNLLFVIDPKSLQIKWRRAGETRGQHDPDWLPDGRIAVIDNRPGRRDSYVVAISPSTYERTVMYDGRHNNFYTRVRGRQEWHHNGLHMLSSPQQGRALELREANTVKLELFNRKPGDAATNYVISEFRWLPPDFFDAGALDCRPASQ